MRKNLIAGFLVLALLLSVVPTAAAATDVTTTAAVGYTDLAADWYRQAAENYGYPEIFAANNTFQPSKPITRMEFARMLHKALDININYFAATDIADYYDDVNNSDTGASELYDMVTAGIIDRKDSIGPNETLSREEMIHYVVNALNYVTGGEYAVIMIMPAPFTDDADITEACKNDIVLAVIMKMVNGRGDNMLYPKAGATRAEAVVLTERLVGLCEDLTSKVKVTVSYEEQESGLKLSMIIANNGDNDVTITHSSGWKYDFKLFDAEGETLYTWSADKLFIMAETETVIAAGESVEFTAEVESGTYDAIKDQIALVKGYIIGTSQDFSIIDEGYFAA